MGQSKKRLDRFLTEHPLCCFCGGGTQASTFDHIPNKAFFIERQWPSGYEFPACNVCQTSARKSELICAAIARSFSFAEPENAQEVLKLWKGLAHNDMDTLKEILGPERLSSLFIPAQARRRLYSREGYPIVNLGERVHSHLKVYIHRITKALYYKHLHTIIPNDLEILYMIVTNAEMGSDRERFLLDMKFTESPDLIRNTPLKNARPLREQFEYYYATDTTSGDAVFRVRLHQTFAFAASVDMSRYRESN